MDPIDFLRRQGLGGRGSWVMGLVVGARAFQPRRHVRVTACVFDHTVGQGKPWVHGGKQVGSDRTGWKFSFQKNKQTKLKKFFWL